MMEDVKERVLTKQKIKLPSKYNIIVHNDDVTPMQFVVLLLVTIFSYSNDDAFKTTEEIHNSEKAVVGEYTHEMGEQKLKEAKDFTEEYGFQLKITLEKI